MIKTIQKITGGKIRSNIGGRIRLNKLKPTLSINIASGETEGEVNLLWEPVRGARTYIIQKGTGTKRPLKWKMEDIVTATFYTISNLKKGVKYRFRVAAVGNKGQGCWSEPVHKILN